MKQVSEQSPEEKADDLKNVSKDVKPTATPAKSGGVVGRMRSDFREDGGRLPRGAWLDEFGRVRTS